MSEEQSEVIEHASLDEAFLAAQAEFPEIPKDKENPHFRSRYSSLDAIKTATRPALNRHGIVTRERTEQENGRLRVTAILRHAKSGQEDANWASIKEAENIQGLGSQITYLRRYALAPLLGVCSDEDDDGNTAATAQAPERGNREAPPRAESRQDARRSDGDAAPPQSASGAKTLPDRAMILGAIGRINSAAGLASYLTDRIGERPVAKSPNGWREILTAAVTRLNAMQWTPEQKAVVEAVLTAIRSDLPALPATGEPAPAPVAAAEPSAAPSLAALRAQVDAMLTPADLLTLLEGFVSGDRPSSVALRADRKLWADLTAHAVELIHERYGRQDAGWGAQDIEAVGSFAYDLKNQAEIESQATEANSGN